MSSNLNGCASALYKSVLCMCNDLPLVCGRCAEEVNILVPGAGLGRLAYELAKRGYTCQGNEFSLFMLFASNFVLNK